MVIGAIGQKISQAAAEEERRVRLPQVDKLSRKDFIKKFTPEKLFSTHNNLHKFFYPLPHSKEYMPKRKRKKTSVKSYILHQMFKFIKVNKK